MASRVIALKEALGRLLAQLTSTSVGAQKISAIDLLLLTAILRLHPNAYAISIVKEVRERTQVELPLRTVYSVLERLEMGALVTASMSDTSPHRGGKRKRTYELTPDGLTALNALLGQHVELGRYAEQLQTLLSRPS